MLPSWLETGWFKDVPALEQLIQQYVPKPRPNWAHSCSGYIFGRTHHKEWCWLWTGWPLVWSPSLINDGGLKEMKAEQTLWLQLNSLAFKVAILGLSYQKLLLSASPTSCAYVTALVWLQCRVQSLNVHFTCIYIQLFTTLSKATSIQQAGNDSSLPSQLAATVKHVFNVFVPFS